MARARERVNRQLPSPNGGNALVRRSSGDHAAVYIRQLIFDGVLRPGDRVPQDEIAGALGISRIPLREALIALEREGWVTLEVHRGAFVNALDSLAIEDHFELFGLIYGLAMRQALARTGVDFVERLAAIEKELSATDSPAEESTLLFALWSTIVDCAHSHRINVALRAISTIVPGNFFAAVPDAIEIEKRSLPAIVRALRRNDADKAADECMKMMRRVAKEVMELFSERGLYESTPPGQTA